MLCENVQFLFHACTFQCIHTSIHAYFQTCILPYTYTSVFTYMHTSLHVFHIFFPHAGQFWNVPVNLEPYTGLDRNGMPVNNRYQINVPSRSLPNTDRSFTGIFYEFNWSHERKPCLYAGNRQAGPIYEIPSPNDPVIEGNYRDYKVPGAFEEEGYKYGLFDSDRCESDASGSLPV